MSHEIDAWCTDLARLRDLYRAMQEVTRRQQAVLATDDLAGLEAVLQEKRELLHQAEGIDARSRPMNEAWRSRRATAPPEILGRVDGLLGEVTAELEALLALEEECRRGIESRQQNTLDELRRLRQDRKARDSYGGGPDPGGPSRFLDTGA